MNFDELKKQWDNQAEPVMKIKNEVLFQKANTPIEKVRRQLRMDFYSNLIMLIVFLLVIIFVPFAPEIKYVCSISSVLVFLFLLYYGVRMYRFYKESYRLEYNSKDTLLWFSYELRLIIEMIKSATFISFFIGIITGLVVGFLLAKLNIQIDSLEAVASIPITWIVIGMIVIFVLVFVGVEFLINVTYGRYYRQIKHILDDLDE